MLLRLLPVSFEKPRGKRNELSRVGSRYHREQHQETIARLLALPSDD